MKMLVNTSPDSLEAKATTNGFHSSGKTKFTALVIIFKRFQNSHSFAKMPHSGTIFKNLFMLSGNPNCNSQVRLKTECHTNLSYAESIVAE